jgi:hypothetical protein
MAETIPGGIYKNPDGTFHDAHGKPVKVDAPPTEPVVPVETLDVSAHALQVHREQHPETVASKTVAEKPVKVGKTPAPDAPK